MLDVANLVQFSKLTKLKQSKLSKRRKVLDENISLSTGNRMTNRPGLSTQTLLSAAMHSWMGWWGHAQRKEFPS